MEAERQAKLQQEETDRLEKESKMTNSERLARIARMPKESERHEFFIAVMNGDLQFVGQFLQAKDVDLNDFFDDVSGHLSSMPGY